MWILHIRVHLRQKSVFTKCLTKVRWSYYAFVTDFLHGIRAGALSYSEQCYFGKDLKGETWLFVFYWRVDR
jgi:hypothetical protein